ncbi:MULTISPECIES: phosphate ABC transporter permease subunit PstC [Lacrimispora]|jgi:phosphate transport system permease protein|uniref:phosphate ABC transporter permease subunit PstC n=1 Tax=Lacrimispora TaxID=2719231 RepID=UPI000BE34419|nr:phosphate ABC transporter permease subunit PstC [Lacrimispora amygdalina]MDK2966843.1 phosphate transport system permease protein [Lacrimispora sp.]
MQPKSYSIFGGHGSKSGIEHAAEVIFTICGFFAVLAVASISIYMLTSGTPALFKVGILDILFGSVWKPDAAIPSFGILYVILTSIVGTALAIVIGVPIGVMTAVFLAEVAPKRLANIVRPAVELLAGIPSVIYGLLGILILNPLMYDLELEIFKGSSTHQFTGGANLISAVLVLALMILPTVINISETALRSVPHHLRSASLALGATKIQTIFQVVIPAAKSGIITAIVLGTGRAIGEAMAISLVSGSSVNFPLPFHSVRFLTTAIVSEMSYASGLHKQVLFTIGLVLFVFIMLINVMLNSLLKKGADKNDK